MLHGIYSISNENNLLETDSDNTIMPESNGAIDDAKYDLGCDLCV